MKRKHWQYFVRPTGGIDLTDHRGISLFDLGHTSEAERESNARLAVAAPDLLEACKFALGQLKGCKPLSGVHVGSLRADIEIVQAAIAKAEGKATP